MSSVWSFKQAEVLGKQLSIMSTPVGVDILFFFFRRLASAFGMGVYWVNSLHGIAFGEDRFIAN